MKSKIRLLTAMWVLMGIVLFDSPLSAAPKAFPVPLNLKKQKQNQREDSEVKTGQTQHSGVRKEIVEKRTLTSKTYDNGDGTYTAVLSTVPMDYLNAGRDWEEIKFSEAKTIAYVESIKEPTKAGWYEKYSSLWVGRHATYAYKYRYRGYAEWNTSIIPDLSTILSIRLRLTAWIFHNYITMNINDVTQKPSAVPSGDYSTLYTDLGTNEGSEPPYVAGLSIEGPSWSFYDYLPDRAESELQANLDQDWFAIGLNSTTDSEDHWVEFYNGDVYYPIIEVTYIPPDIEPPSVTVLQPSTGGIILGAGDTYEIKWTASDNDLVRYVEFWYSVDGGISYLFIDRKDNAGNNNPWNGSYPWTVPDVASDKCRIMVKAYDYSLNEGVDESDNNFEIIYFDASKWTSLGPAYYTENAIAINPIYTNIVYKAEDYTVMKSTDFGNTWTMVLNLSESNGFVEYADVECLAIDPTNPDIIYAGAAEGSAPPNQFWGVWKSTDGGNSWSKVLPNYSIFSIAINPSATGIIYVGGTEGYMGDLPLRIFKTTNGGANWILKTMGLPSYNLVTSLVIDPINTNVIYGGLAWAGPVSIYTIGVWKSTNGGESWFQTSNGLFGDPDKYPYIYALATDPSTPSIVYAGVGYDGGYSPPHIYGVYKTTDGAANWTECNGNGAIPSGSFVYALAIDPKNSACVYAGAGNIYETPSVTKVYMTANKALNWIDASKNIVNRSVISLALNPVEPSIVYAGTQYGGLYR